MTESYRDKSLRAARPRFHLQYGSLNGKMLLGKTDWDEGKHPRGVGGRFGSGGSVQTTDGTRAKPDGESRGRYDREIDYSRSLEGVDPADLAEDPTAYRIQDGSKEMPERSANMWTDADEETMPGTSGYANLSNALDDMIFGETESVTGENYSSVAAEPEVWFLVSDRSPVDGPGAEVIVRDARPSGKLSKSQLEHVFREVLFDEGAEEAFDKTPEELAEDYDFDKYEIYKEMETRIRDALRDASNAET